MNAWEKVLTARHIKRPQARYYINELFTSFIEFHGDRLFKDDKAIIGGIALFKGMPITVIGIQKGETTNENIERNFGQVHPEGYRKALRLMKQAEKFKRPIIIFVNTSGAYCGIGAEERGQGEAIAKNLFEMSNIKVPIISIITGEGGSGGALALSVSDRVWCLENAVYSILSPEGFASILWKDNKRAKEAAEIMKLTADDLYYFKIVEKIIKEDKKGAHSDPHITVEHLRESLSEELKLLLSKSQHELIEERYERFRKFGSYKFI